MTENKRFMVDDTGTLIDMKTRNTYDYVSDVVDLLNDLQQEAKDNEHYHSVVLRLYKAVSEENVELKKEVKQLKNKIKTYNSTHELLKETIDRLRSDG